MIPVRLQPEPARFHALVRQKGLRWLKMHNIPLDRRLPVGTQIKPCWRACLNDLHTAYAGVCAYLCVYIEREVGGATVDHYVAKSRRADLAYEWDNYRLASARMNSRKRDYSTVLDPFTLKADTFRLELVTGRVYANPDLKKVRFDRAKKTIERLGLDSSGFRMMRVRHYFNYREKGYPAGYLLEYSPFVYVEAKRQGLL